MAIELLRKLRQVTASLLSDESHDRNVLEREVLRYLVEHPSAADSIEGVRLWWLRHLGQASEPLLQTVLDQLLKRGWLVTRGDRPESKIYSLNERERTAVEKYVSERREPSDG